MSAQSEHDSLDAKRPRMDTVVEGHISRAPPTAGGAVLPMTHSVQDGLRTADEVKKVRFPLTFATQEVTYSFLSWQRQYLCNFFSSS